MELKNGLLKQAVCETKYLNSDEVVLVRDLFKGYEWNRILRKNRFLLGTLFLNYVPISKNSLQPIEKSSSGQQNIWFVITDLNYIIIN